MTWNRRYHLTDIDAQVKEATGAVSHPDFLLTEPWEVRTGSGTPYRVFTPFSKKAQGMLLDAPPSPTPAPAVEGLEGVEGASTSVDEPESSATLAAHCTPGDRMARGRAPRDGPRCATPRAARPLTARGDGRAACRRRRGLQPLQLAMGRGLRGRRRAVLPYLQSAHAAAEVRP
nr:deoxyribodipyrimidine photo-lyase [Corynebacterium gottingense]